MPFLQIDNVIVSNPSRAHLSIIESWMLFPDDEGKRLDAQKAAVVEIGRDLMRQIKLDASTLKELFELAAGAKPLDQLREMVPIPYQHGIMAGHILIAAIDGKDAKGDRLKLGEINKMLAESFAPQRGDKSSFVHAIWKQYRPVSHLWAAYIEVSEQRPTRPVFPCELQEVIDFLWLSEDWRLKGEGTKTRPRAPSTILRPGDAVRTPEAMKFSKKLWNT
jgi:hypothetical protein